METKIPDEKTIPVLIIDNWNASFENAKSRTVNHKAYGQFLLKQGRGYCRLMMEKDGAAIYGTFIALVGIVQAKPQPREGYLTETGNETGYPLSFEDMAGITRIPVKIIKRALTVLSSRAVGWIHADTMRIPDGYHEDTSISQEYARYTGTVLYCTVGTVIKQPKTETRKDYPPEFEKLWNFYPGGGAKKRAFQSFKKSGIEAEEMATAIQNQIDFRSKLKASGEFIPSWADLVTWINGERWNDKIEKQEEESKPEAPIFKAEFKNKDDIFKTKVFDSAKERQTVMAEHGYMHEEGDRWKLKP